MTRLTTATSYYTTYNVYSMLERSLVICHGFDKENRIDQYSHPLEIDQCVSSMTNRILCNRHVWLHQALFIYKTFEGENFVNTLIYFFL